MNMMKIKMSLPDGATFEIIDGEIEIDLRDIKGVKKLYEKINIVLEKNGNILDEKSLAVYNEKKFELI